MLGRRCCLMNTIIAHPSAYTYTHNINYIYMCVKPKASGRQPIRSAIYLASSVVLVDASYIYGRNTANQRRLDALHGCENRARCPRRKQQYVSDNLCARLVWCVWVCVECDCVVIVWPSDKLGTSIYTIHSTKTLREHTKLKPQNYYNEQCVRSPQQIIFARVRWNNT